MDDKYPKELLTNRNQIEASFIFALWKNPDLYGDYLKLSEEDFLTDDGNFYFLLGKELYKKGYRSFNELAILGFLKDYELLAERFERCGGYQSVKEMINLVSVDNIEGYFDELVKSNMLLKLYDQGFDVLKQLDKFKLMNSGQIYDYFEYQLNSIAIDTSSNIEIEDLVIDKSFVDECNAGIENGLSYMQSCPILNGITMGLPLGELFMIGGYSGVGKSSFVFENMLLPLNKQGIKVAVISNEQRSKDFKFLLAAHILTHDIDQETEEYKNRGYWKLTRKKLKKGEFTEEELDKLDEVIKISGEEYSDIKFVKLFDNDMKKVMKIIKKLSKLGYQAFLFDTMKSENTQDGVIWQQLLMNSRDLFQLASKENISIICTYQLALGTLNRRYLDASCLSNAKQVKEVFSEMIYLRELWDDEREGEKYYVEPYRLKKDENGKFTNTKVIKKIEKDRRYVVAFVDKTRNDEGKKQILYEFNGSYNRWREVGMVHVINDHMW